MRTHAAVSLLALIAGALSGQAQGKELKPEPDSVLADMRAGFVTAGGLTFDIGITTSTYINGQLALTTSVATSPTAPTGPTAPTAPTSPTAPTTPTSPSLPAGSGGAPASPAPAASPSAPAPAAATTTGSSSAPAAVAPPVQTASTQAPAAPAGAPSAPASGGTAAQAPTTQAASIQPPGQGPAPAATPSSTTQTVTASTPDGQTMVIQNPGQLVNVVTNSANGQDIRLDTVVNVVLPGFDTVQRGQMLSGMGMKIGADGSFGIVSSLSH